MSRRGGGKEEGREGEQERWREGGRAGEVEGGREKQMMKEIINTPNNLQNQNHLVLVALFVALVAGYQRVAEKSRILIGSESRVVPMTASTLGSVISITNLGNQTWELQQSH